METTCKDCRITYDDAERLTFCPHDALYPPEILKQKDLGLSLIGKMVRFAHMAGSQAPASRVTTVMHDGMVCIEGFSGEFAPSLFVVVD